jgi:predicted P-loop ATPase
MTKDERAAVKDVGGFVGGTLSDGTRHKGSVSWRTLLVLDADNANMDLLEDFAKLGIRGVIHSTHSHTSAKPKFRAVIPLATSVTPEVYPAHINYLAVKLGVDQFDATMDQAHRLMYWPSVSKDADYIYRKYDGDYYDPNTIDPIWLDVGSWQLSNKNATDRAEKAEDPTLKKGLIGAFCRVYDIYSALETFLPDTYTGEGDRYTYVGSETAAGAIVYGDGKWLYSNHHHDPACSVLCNAWDLVRIHLFGDQDEVDQSDVDDISKLKSQKAMEEYVQEMPDVAEEAMFHSLAEAVSAFDEESLVRVEDRDWMKKLVTNKRGQVLDNIWNCKVLLLNDPRLKDRIKYNEMSDRVWASSELPWRKGLGGSWSDPDMSQLFLYMEKYGITNRANIKDALMSVKQEVRFHPVRDYLDSLVWDGVPRCETLFIEYLGAEDNAFVREATKKWMISAVARIMEPGCQFDEMLILAGAQGIGKSTILRRLAGGEWFNDSIDKLSGGKEAAEQLRGYWVVCVDELAGYKKSDEESIKNFLSRTSDSYRPAYGTSVMDFPRQCAFVGTTNSKQFLKDHTGGRRFWIIDVNKKDPRIWASDFPRDQLWAEAYAYYMLDEDRRLSNEAEKIALKIQGLFQETDDLVGLLEEFIHTKVPEEYEEWDIPRKRDWLIDKTDVTPGGVVLRKRFCPLEIWCEMLGRDKKDFSPIEQRRIKTIMRQAPSLEESSSTHRFKQYGTQRFFILR